MPTSAVPATEGAIIEEYRKRFVVEHGERVRLGKLDPAYTGKLDGREAVGEATARYLEKLAAGQYLLYADQRRSLLIVLQGLDASGKDGTIRHVMGAFNPQGAIVTAFKEPTLEERAHDFLWRVHPHVPRKGTIAIFNRSHYEDVIVPRVHEQIDAETCDERYDSIRAFEHLLVEDRTHVLKFFLHISKAEQLARFGARLDDPTRNWKISEADYTERECWDDYLEAYQDALRATSTRRSPWYVIPSDHKWFRDLAISQIVADTLDDLHLTFPKPAVDIDELRERYHAAQSGR